MERAEFGHELPLADTFHEPNEVRRRLLKFLIASGVASALNLPNLASGQESNEPGLGQQSHLWLPATHDNGGYFGPYDQLAQLRFGNRALSSETKFGPTGARIRQRQISQLNASPNFQSSAGQCFAAAIAMGDCPIIQGPKTIDGITFSWEQRMVYAPTFYGGSKVEIGWGSQPDPGSYYGQNVEERGSINPAEFEYIKSIQFENQYYKYDKDHRKHFVVETGAARQEAGEWWVYLMGTAGDYLVTTDIISWDGLGSQPHRLPFKRIHYSQAGRIVLVDPSQAHPGSESLYNETVERPLMAEILNLA